MWLEKHVFCRSSCAPTSNNLYLAECLVSGVDLPLGKYLLGSFYHLMDQVSRNLLENKPIGTINGPWWLLQLWLNLYMHKMVAVDLRNLSFPFFNYLEDQEKLLDQGKDFVDIHLSTRQHWQSASLLTSMNFLKDSIRVFLLMS